MPLLHLWGAYTRPMVQVKYLLQSVASATVVRGAQDVHGGVGLHAPDDWQKKTVKTVSTSTCLFKAPPTHIAVRGESVWWNGFCVSFLRAWFEVSRSAVPECCKYKPFVVSMFPHWHTGTQADELKLWTVSYLRPSLFYSRYVDFRSSYYWRTLVASHCCYSGVVTITRLFV